MNGFSTSPLTVETETIIPNSASVAPNAAAKMGKSGVLPI